MKPGPWLITTSWPVRIASAAAAQCRGAGASVVRVTDNGKSAPGARLVREKYIDNIF